MDQGPEFQKFAADINQAKKERRLHSWVEERLSELLKHLYPNSSPVEEVGGILGGRNDLIQFFPNGQRVVFELFATVSQVPQDLRLLEHSAADAKIAILLDEQVNPHLAKEYFRKKPDHFPYLWLSDVLMPEHESRCLIRLREAIESRFERRVGVSGDTFEKRRPYYDDLKKLLREAYISDQSRPDTNLQFQVRDSEFSKQKDEFVLVFGNDRNIAAYLDQVRTKCIDLCHIRYRLYISNNPATGEERKTLTEQEKELWQWFYDQYRDGMREVFSKHMSLR